MMKIALVAVLLGAAMAAPAKLDHLVPRPRARGYNYQPPAQPSGLYETPDRTTTTPTTTTTTTPPPPPPASYLPPEESAPPSVVHIPDPAPMGKMLMPYNFKYDVDDDEYGTRFHHTEDSDGEYVTGEYSVLLPDGRTQLVRFKSDPVNGYTADVTYF